MRMMTIRWLVAISDLVLIFPAVLFLGAVLARGLPAVTFPAQAIVTWYADRLWTLWILLISLPFAALITGIVTLFVGKGTASGSVQEQAPIVTWIIAVTSVAACFILMIVSLHVLAN